MNNFIETLPSEVEKIDYWYDKYQETTPDLLMKFFLGNALLFIISFFMFEPFNNLFYTSLIAFFIVPVLIILYTDCRYNAKFIKKRDLLVNSFKSFLKHENNREQIQGLIGKYSSNELLLAKTNQYCLEPSNIDYDYITEIKDALHKLSKDNINEIFIKEKEMNSSIKI